MPSVDEDLIRRAIGHRYRLERELGRGGMGTVYLARELELDRFIALKVLPTHVVHDSSLRDRFLRESRTAASFSHPNIVPVYSVVEQDDVLAFAMGYVEGESLAQRVSRAGPLTAREAVRLMHDVSYALAYAHSRGTVHRDIKPDNIMLDRATNRALVMDFGVARRLDQASAAAGLTRVGEVVGTPEYMSPEQATGDAVDGRSDLYSLGLVLWFALTGTAAMGGDSAPRVLVRQLTEVLPPIATRRLDIPPSLARAIDRCVAKNPDDRFADAAALATALDDATLTAPDIPLPIRLLGRELIFLSGALPLGVLLGLMLLRRLLAAGIADLDVLAPIVLLIAGLLARVGQALSDARRIARRGFSFNAMLRGLRAVTDEESSAREVLRLDPETRADRQRAIRAAFGLLLVVVACIATALVLRSQDTRALALDGPVRGVLFFCGVAAFGGAVLLALRDPRLEPLSERVYRTFWLRAPGRWLLRRAMHRGANDAGDSVSGVRQAAVMREAARHAARGVPNGEGLPTGDLADLEARVRELETWRRSLTP